MLALLKVNDAWRLVTKTFVTRSVDEPPSEEAPEGPSREALEKVMADFVQGWREGDRAILGRVFEMTNGRITWVSGDTPDQRVSSMTFRAAVDRDRQHPDYGTDGWRIVWLNVIDDELATAKLEIMDGEQVSVDHMICQRVGGQWRIVGNTFAVIEASEP